MWFDQTGLPWVNPSPNIRSPLEALLYSGVGLPNDQSSVGRGTDTPFEVVGAPWNQHPAGLADALNALGLAGVLFQPVNFQPRPVSMRSDGGGVRLVVTDREAIRPVSVGLALGRLLLDRYPAQFRPAAIRTFS